MAGIDLIFSAPPRVPGAPVDLVFGKSAAPVIATVTVGAAGKITGIRQPVTLALGVLAQASGRLTGIRQPVLARYDINVSRPTVAATRALWQDAATASTTTTAIYRDALRTPAQVREHWQDAAAMRAVSTAHFEQALHLSHSADVRFEQAERAPAAPVLVRFEQALHLSHRAGVRFEQAERVPTRPALRRFEVAYTDRQARVVVAFQVAQRLQQPTASGMGNARRLPVALARAYQQAWPPRPGRWTPPLPPVPLVRVPSTHLVFACPPWAGGAVHLVFGRVCRPPVGPLAPLYILPARYFMAVHTLEAHRLPDLAPMPIFDVSLSADAGSFAWTFSAGGPAHLFDALAPAAGLPAQIRITLDGIPFAFIVDSLQREERFGKRGTRISGRSATALLARPYAREASRLNATSATAQQLAEQALEFSGATLDWGLTDWLVPAGAWSHTGTPLAAVQAIVEAAGGYVQSHRTAATLLARHPYPELPGGIPGAPWNWGGAFAADVELAPDAIITSGIERRDGPDINGVYVSGTTQGVLALVKRTGTAADKLASLITDPLITAQEAALQRGLSVLGAAGPKHSVQIELPILTGTGQPGVLDVGQLVQINAASPWRGRVRSVSVNAAMPKARQTVQIERHLETA